MAILRNEGVACRSSITFHSGSLRDGIHYMAARETDKGRGGKKRKEKDMKIDRHEEGEKKREKRK